MSFEYLMLEYSGIQLIDGDRGSNYPKQNDFLDAGHCLFLSAKNVTKSGFQFSEKVYVSEERHTLLRAGTLNRNDIVLTTRGTVGNVAFYDSSVADDVVRINSGMLILRPDQSVWNPQFLYFLFTSKIIQEQIASLTSGSAVPQLPAKDLKKFSLPNVPMTIQNYIAKVIGDISDKLAVNTKTNQTLEEMAQAIFKSWFVDFDPVKAKMNGEQPEGMNAATAALFPDKLVESELGLIPEGWAVLPFKSVIDKYVDNRGKTPPIVDEGIPLVEVKHLLENSAFPNLNTEKRVTGETFNSWFRVHVEPKDVLISTVGTIGRTSYVKNTDFGIAQNVLGLRFGKIAEPGYMFYTIKAERFQHEMDARLVTTVQSSIKRKDLDTISILIPPSRTQQTFCLIVEQFLDTQYSKTVENIELAKLRDTLLPKLLSGEIELEQTEELAEVAYE